MKIRYIFTLIGVILFIVIGYIFLKNVFFSINRFEKIFEETAQVKKVKIVKKTFTLTDVYRGKDTVIDLTKTKFSVFHFWATWCKPCVKELKDLHAFYKNNKQFNLILISEEELSKQKSFIEKNSFKLPFFKLDKEEYFLSIDSLPLPYNCIIMNGAIEKSYIGTTNWDNFNAIYKDSID